MNNMVSAAVVGVGNMGSNHAKNIFAGKIEGMRLAAVCDNDPKKLAWAKESFGDGVRYFADYKDLLAFDGIDAVIIAVPHYFHCEFAIAAFAKGLNVLTEKPAGVFTKQVEAMNSAAAKSGKVFAIMYNQRTNPLFQKVREMVHTGELGQTKRFVWIITNWYRTQAYYDSGTWRASWGGEGGGVLINQCPHNLDLWQWIFGMPKSINGFCDYGKYHHIEVEDDVTARAVYENGATALFVSTTGEYPGTNRIEISGDLGKVVVENQTLKHWRLLRPESEYRFSAGPKSPKPETEYTETVFDGNGSGHCGILQNFTNAILFGEKLISPGYEGINGLTISNAIHLSDWTKQEVTLPIDKELYLQKLNEHIVASKKSVNFSSNIDPAHGIYSDRWDIKW